MLQTNISITFRFFWGRISKNSKVFKSNIFELPFVMYKPKWQKQSNSCSLVDNVALGYVDHTIVIETIRFTKYNQREAYKN